MIGGNFGLLSNLSCYPCGNSENIRQQRLKNAPTQPMNRCYRLKYFLDR